MALTPDALQKEFPPRFVRADDDFGNWDRIEPYYSSLAQRPINSVKQLEQWLEDWSELEAYISEEGARRYIEMTCHTDDETKRKRYLEFAERIEPAAKEAAHRLKSRYVTLSQRGQLPRPRYEVLDRLVQRDVELFREENIPLEVREEQLGTEYRHICGNMTVVYRGKEHTLQQMARYLEEPDRAVREEAWRLVAERRLQERERFDELFDQLLDLRHQIARNAGFDSYVQFRFKQLGRFDYTPEDCFRFHQAVEHAVLPLLRKLQEDRRRRLGVDRLRPWDLAVDPDGKPPLRPFETGAELAEKTVRVFRRLDPVLGEIFDAIRHRGLLDLESRKGKAPGGYQQTLNASRLPFIFMNAAGLDRDVTTLLHEAGHAFHTVACREDPILAYRHAPMEFCEVASMSMELLAEPMLDEFYGPEDLARRTRRHLEGIVSILAWIAQIDAFQHWLYTHPGHSHQQRVAAWLELDERFGPGIDWTGLEDVRRHYWQRQLHLFEHPFYYIEYGIAQIGALGLWRQAKEDASAALARYKQALELGGSRPLPELFAAAGLAFEFTEHALAPLMEQVEAALQPE